MYPIERPVRGSNKSPYRIQCNSSSNRSPYRIKCNSSSNKYPYRIKCNSSSNKYPYRIQCNSSSNKYPYRIQCNSSSNKYPYRIKCNGSSNKYPYRIKCNSNSNKYPYRIQCNSSSNLWIELHTNTLHIHRYTISLQHYTPEPPVDAEKSEAPTLQFTYVECLLFSFHETVKLVSTYKDLCTVLSVSILLLF